MTLLNARPYLAIVLLAGVFLVLHAITGGLSLVYDSPFYHYFDDVPVLLFMVIGIYLLVAVLLDGTLLLSGGLDAWNTRSATNTVDWRNAWRAHGLLSLGAWPLLMMLITGYGLLLSANITLLSLTRIHNGVSFWHDAWFWQFESGIIEWFAHHIALIPLVDVLYVLCWPIQICALLLLFLRQRSPHAMLLFCASYGLLYFSGRWIGCLMPVLGPIFYAPEFYTHMKATMTIAQVHLVQGMFVLPPEALNKSGVLLGGISAMPSLHVAMVSLCSYWLWREFRWALPLLVGWVLMTWYATVALGWHYALDGLGGMLLATGVVALVRMVEHRQIVAVE